MNQWLPSSGRQWIVQFVVLFILGGVAYQYFTASAEARLLDGQLRIANQAVEAKTDSLVDERAVSDALIAAQDSAQAADTAAVNEAAVVSDETASETAVALAEAREAAAGMPVVQAALERAETALAASEAARLEERATSAAAVFAGQQRERILGMQLINERGASDEVIAGLRTSLSISMEESNAWERAATPGALKSIFVQGRAALLAIVIVLAVK